MQADVAYAIVFGVIGTFLSVVMVLQGWGRLRVRVTDVEAQANEQIGRSTTERLESHDLGPTSTNNSDDNTNLNADSMHSFTTFALDRMVVEDRHVATDVETRSEELGPPVVNGSLNVDNGKRSNHQIAASPCQDDDVVVDNNGHVNDGVATREAEFLTNDTIVGTGK